MKKSKTQSRGTTATQGRSKSGAMSDRRSSQMQRDNNSSGRDNLGRSRDEGGRFTTDDGGYYSQANSRSGRGFQDSDSQARNDQGSTYRGDSGDQGGAGYRDWQNDGYTSTGRQESTDYSSSRNPGQRNAPYRSSEGNYNSGGRFDGDNQSNSASTDTNSRPMSRRSSNRDYDSQNNERNEYDSKYGGRGVNDVELPQEFSRRNLNESSELDSGRNTNRSARYSDEDNTEGQWDEDYRDRDQYKYGSLNVSDGGRRDGSGYRR